MLTENRKRRRSCGHDEGQLTPQPKRPAGGCPLIPELGRDTWDSELSSSDSSGVSSPERSAGSTSSKCLMTSRGGHTAQSPCSPVGSTHVTLTPLCVYHHINRVLREAHFHSLHSREQARDT